MAKKRDTKAPRSVKGEFDDRDFSTSHGGAVLLAKAFRRLGVRKVFENQLPTRKGTYSSADVAHQVIAGLLCGGRGFCATRPLLLETGLAKIFGFKNVGSGSTVYRAMCDFASLKQRTRDDVYTESGTRLPAMTIFGEEAAHSKHIRTVPEEPEIMSPESQEKLQKLLSKSTLSVAKSLPMENLCLYNYTPVFGDGTDLEVRGHCFDGARKNKDGNKCLRAMSIMVGPVVVSLNILPGNSDEGKSLPQLIENSYETIKEISGKRQPLALLDSAFAEKEVVHTLEKRNYKFIIGANQWRASLEKLVSEQPKSQWKSTGADKRRGWAESAVLVMTHKPEGWNNKVTVVVRRYRKEDETCERYRFLYTNLEPEDLPKCRVDKFGYASLIWQLYGTKQGRENNFKTLLSDLGLHNPTSGRMGVTQAFAILAAVAANIHAYLAYRIVPEKDRGIRLWRFVKEYVLISGKPVMQAGRRLIVRLAGGGITEDRKDRWLLAQANLEAA